MCGGTAPPLQHGVGPKDLPVNFKVSVRNVRRKFIDQIKKLEKDKLLSMDESKKFQDDIQKSTDNAISNLDKTTKLKENDILKV